MQPALTCLAEKGGQAAGRHHIKQPMEECHPVSAEISATKHTALKILSLLGTPARGGKMARVIGAAPLSPTQERKMNSHHGPSDQQQHHSDQEPSTRPAPSTPKHDGAAPGHNPSRVNGEKAIHPQARAERGERPASSRLMRLIAQAAKLPNCQ